MLRACDVATVLPVLEGRNIRMNAGTCTKVAKCYPEAMSQPVKLSDQLVLDARLSGEVTERSIAGQIEFWAGIGRGLERVMHMDQVLALKQRGQIEPLSKALASVDSAEGRQRLSEVLASRPYPHFESSARPGLVVRVDEDGTRTEGRFVQRKFVAASTP